MKNFIYNFLLSCICLVVASCNNEATIGGTAENTKEICLFQFDKGHKTLVQKSVVDKQTGVFEIVVALPSDGLYLLGINDKALYPVYLTGGDNISVLFKDNTMLMSSDNASDENALLFLWENGVNDVKNSAFFHYFLPGAHSVAPEKFFASLEKAISLKETVLNSLEGKKGEFYQFLNNKINADLDFYALNYLRNSGLNVSDTEQYTNYYNNIGNNTVFQNIKLLDIPFAGKMLQTYVWFTNNGIDCLKDKTLQQEYLLAEAEQMKYYDEYENMLEQFGDDFFDSSYSSKLKQLEEKLLWSKPGLPAPDFKAMAPDSSWMNLSDYKGKVVVIDVWATWCEPCRRMMPLFHELQKEFTNENVEFLSVCVGVWIESEKWLQLNKKTKKPEIVIGGKVVYHG